MSATKTLGLMLGTAVVASGITWAVLSNKGPVEGIDLPAPVGEVAPPPEAPDTSVEPVPPVPPVPDAKTPMADGMRAIYWMQQSAEYEATMDALYDIARQSLDAALADPSWTALEGAEIEGKPPAVILDVDETVLDNTAYQVWAYANNKNFSYDSWREFCRSEQSIAIAPALAFTQYAASKGVAVYYVTNRNVVIKESTRSNLAKEGFPLSDEVDTLLMKEEQEDWTSKKETRWAYVAKDHRVVLLIGDNLGDVAEGIYDTPAKRKEIVATNADKIGKSWIVLPNPAYGSWEGAAYDFNYRRSADEKYEVLHTRLRDWEQSEADESAE